MKTIGIMLVAGMLCAIMATGCTASDNSNNQSSQNPTEATAEAKTEATTKATTKSEADSTTATDEEFKTDPFIIKAGHYDDINDVGITVETTNSNHWYLDTTSAEEAVWGTKIKDDRIKAVYSIHMGYRVNEPDENGVFEYSETELNEKVKVNIPSEEGLYLIRCEGGIAYDVATEYIDGSYVFETDRLGKFMLSTVSTGRTEPVKTEKVELVQQTITDEATGIQVSGMLPVDAEMDVLLCFYNEYRLHSYDPMLDCNFEENYPKPDDISEFFYETEDERLVDTEAGRFSATMSKPDWIDYLETEQSELELKLTFIKNFEILEFESDLTITLPFDYRNGLANINRKGSVSAMQYDYNKKEFITLEVLPLNAAESNFQFKAKAPGQFFMGKSTDIKAIKRFYVSGPSVEIIKNIF